MMDSNDKLGFRKTTIDSVERARSYLALRHMDTMDILYQIQDNWRNDEIISPGDPVYIRVKNKFLGHMTHLIRVNIKEHKMYVGIDKITNYFEIYYPCYMLYLISSNNYTALDDGSMLGKQLPCYLNIQSTGDYFNYIVQHDNIDVPYEFFIVLNNLHDKIKTL